MPGFVSWVLVFVFWVLGFVFWVLGIVFWVLGVVFWVAAPDQLGRKRSLPDAPLGLRRWVL